MNKREMAKYMRGAANFLERNPNRWKKFTLCEGTGRKAQFCALGAVAREEYGQKRVIDEYLYPSFQDTIVELISLNDNMESTVEDVIRGLRKGARQLEHGYDRVVL